MNDLSEIPPELLGSPHRLMVYLLPEADRSVLRRLAVPRFVDPEVAEILTEDPEARQRLSSHPLLRTATWDPRGRIRVFDDGIRSALLETYFEGRPSDDPGDWIPSDLADVHARLAAHYRAAATPFEGLYHRLGSVGERQAALDEIEARVEANLEIHPYDGTTQHPDGGSLNVAGAHDLLRLLEDWARLGDSEAEVLHRRLTPRLARRSRWVREREATRTYYRRTFEDETWRRLRDSAERWILQLHAPGGAGKTMFVQNLLGRICPSEEIPCARIDFDYVAHLVTATNQPWRILLLIARQLDRQLEGSPFDGLLERFGRFEAKVFPATPGRRLGTLERLDAGADTELGHAASEIPAQFRYLLAESRGDRPVVVVLDTLENLLEAEGATLLGLIDELARVRHGEAGEPPGPGDEPGGTADRVPGLRLVLSGRFDLAGSRHETWGGAGERRVDRVVGFRERYVGEGEPETVALGGTTLEQGRQVTTLLLPRFSDQEALDYLARHCAVGDADLRAAITEKADGNPMKLTLLADEVAQDSSLDAERIRAFRSTDLVYLVNRVIDRILDPQVQWLVRWGVVPRLLTRDFVERILWPLFKEYHAGRKTLDRTEAETGTVPAPSTGVERYAAVEPDEDAEAVWRALTHYAAAASWVSVVPELTDTLVFHPDVRDPMRGLLRDHDQTIYHELNRRSFLDLKRRAPKLEGGQRVAALRSLVFHAWEPWRGRPEDPDAFLAALLDGLGDDRGLRSQVAREVLDIARRAEQDSRDLEPPNLRSLARAHTEIARFLAQEIDTDPTLLPQLREHLDRSDLPTGLRERFEGVALIAEGRPDEAEAAFALALEDPALDPGLRAATLLDLGGLRDDETLLAQALELAPDDTMRRRAQLEIAELAFEREEFARAEPLFAELDAPADRARCLVWLGKLDAAASMVEQCPPETRGGLRILVDLYGYRPQSTIDAIFRAEGSSPIDPLWWIHQARAFAMLGQEDEALSRLEGLISGGEDVGAVVSAVQTAAWLALLRDRPKEAQEYLSRLPDDLPTDLAIRARLLEVETEAELDRIEPSIERSRLEEAWRRLEALDTELPDRRAPHGEGSPWSPSSRVAVALARLNFRGVEREGLGRLLDALETADSPSRRLFLLPRLRWVGTPTEPSPRHERDALLKLTRLADDDGPRLALARADLLRILHRPDEARQLLEPWLAPDPEHVVWRYARLSLDRVGWGDIDPDQPPAPETFPEPFRQRVAEEQQQRLGAGVLPPGQERLGPRISLVTPGRGWTRGHSMSKGRDHFESRGGGGTKTGYSVRVIDPGESLGGGGSKVRPGLDGSAVFEIDFSLDETELEPGPGGPPEKTAPPPAPTPDPTGDPTGDTYFRRPTPEAETTLAELVELRDGKRRFLSTRHARRFVDGWHEIRESMGRKILPLEMFTHLEVGDPNQEPRDLVISPGSDDGTWIPWHLATVEGRPLTQLPGVRSVVRSAMVPPTGDEANGSAPSVPLRHAAVVSSLEGTGSKGPNWTELALKTWYRDYKGTTYELVGLVEKALPPELGALHLVAPLEERRSSVVLRIDSEWGDSLGAAQLARILAKRETPLLIVLDTPWPGSQVQAAHQLMLREMFAAELAREAPQSHLLATGFAQTETRSGWLRPFLRGLGEGESLGQIAARLQRLDDVLDEKSSGEEEPSFARTLLARGTVLYSQRPDTRFVPG